MWQFSGEINYKCLKCSIEDKTSISNFNVEDAGGTPQSSGMETLYSLEYDFSCPHCGQEIELGFLFSEYPSGVFNSCNHESTGAEILNNPEYHYDCKYEQESELA